MPNSIKKGKSKFKGVGLAKSDFKIRNELQQKKQKLINEVKSLEGANDEIKNDYCQLAAEKETIERHYENLESKLKSMNASKNASSIQESAESLKLLQVRLKFHEFSTYSTTI